MTKKRKILVTSALLYANGDLHLGHMLESIQTDIWVRFQKMQQQECYYISGSDAHGTPIMLKAEQQQVTPEELIKHYQREHAKTLNNFLINMDNFHTTHSSENQSLVNEFYYRLKENKSIFTKTIEQAYDPKKQMFLPDRYIKGTCPKCKTPDQYGDSCEACGTTYHSSDLIEPYSVVSGAKPINKTTEHLFFDLPQYTSIVQNWLETSSQTQPEINKKLQEWFAAGLKPWDITRDAPYFGYEVPDSPGKYFYVWLDAPIGYLASLENFCKTNKLAFDYHAFWDIGASENTEVYHFIGKDIVYFHTLFWPAMLSGCNLRLPSSVYVHGFLTVNGNKMSKSRGTFITANTYLKYLKPEYLRYYLAAKLNHTLEDIDLNLSDFCARVNSDLVGKFVNIASRCGKIINNIFANKLSPTLPEPELTQEFIMANTKIADLYEQRDYGAAMREIMSLADRANKYIDEQKPWLQIKQDDTKLLAQQSCTQALELFKILLIYLKPVLPELAAQAEKFLNIQKPLIWEDIHNPITNNSVINTFSPLLERITEEQVNKMIEVPVEPQVKAPAVTAATAAAKDTKSESKYISYDDFAKVDLRIGKIVEASHVEGAEKLLRLMIDIGEEKPRQIFAGIKSSFQPEQLIGRHTVIVANLEPRKMRFGLSEGMVIVASGPQGGELYLVEAQAGAEPGMRVK